MCYFEVEVKKFGGIIYSIIYFFGDKVYEGGNDWEIYSDFCIIGYVVEDFVDIMC